MNYLLNNLLDNKFINIIFKMLDCKVKLNQL